MKHDKEATKKVNTDTKRMTKTRRLTSRIFIGVSVSLALIYIVFVFVTTNFMGNDNLVTQIVYKTSASDIIRAEGFVIRDEEYIDNTSNGILVYKISDGDKVKSGGTIASIYSKESDVTNSQRIKELDDAIANIENLSKTTNSASAGLDSVNNQINQKLISFVSNINERSFDSIDDNEDDLMNSIYRKQIITGDLTNFDETLSSLKEERSSLLACTSDAVGSITCDKSGYFVSSVDGYEKAFDVEDMSQIRVADLENAKPENIAEDKYIGKIIQGVNWYVACVVTSDEATAITHNDSSVKLKLPYAMTESVPAKVVSVNQFNGDEKTVVILQCSNMNTALAKIRKENVDIELNSYKGLKIPKVALHDDIVTKTVVDDNDNKSTEQSKVQGVFVKYGSELIFKQVQILYSADDYVICNESPEDGTMFNGTTVSLYDEVVVEGENLYDGKLIK